MLVSHTPPLGGRPLDDPESLNFCLSVCVCVEGRVEVLSHIRLVHTLDLG